MGLIKGLKKLDTYSLSFFYSVKAVKLLRYIFYIGGRWPDFYMSMWTRGRWCTKWLQMSTIGR